MRVRGPVYTSPPAIECACACVCACVCTRASLSVPVHLYDNISYKHS